MRKSLITAAAVAGVTVAAAGTALAVSGSPAGSSVGTPGQIAGCVVGSSRTLEHVYTDGANLKSCPKGSFAAAWNKGGKGSAGPAGPQGPAGAAGPAGPAGPSGVVGTKTTDLGAVASVPTGGGFVANATKVGTVDLKAGTYLVSMNAKATPPSGGTGSVEVFPQFFVYNQAANASFTGDLFNVGSGALESGTNANIDSYFGGSTVITLSSDTTLYVYAFGYDSDRGAGSYTLDDLQITATQIHPGS